MLYNKNLLFFLFLTLGTLSVKSQDCKSLEKKGTHIEISDLPGETMGQKLASLLFWSQDEKERR